jgi:hypothetical protein
VKGQAKERKRRGMTKRWTNKGIRNEYRKE